MSKIGVYIHIPFCVSKCAYCAFTSFRCDNATIDAYIDALIAEIESTLNADDIIDTLYIGGGTPSILRHEDIRRIVDSVKRRATWMPREVTIECNPESLTREKIEAYKDIGITRISIGVQSLDDDILHTIGRVHSSNEAIDKVRLAVETGMNTSVDMILGLPNSTLDDITHCVETFSDIGVQHISSYSLGVEPGTRLADMVDNGEVTLPSEDETVDQYEWAYRCLAEHGYHRYEVSNFARRGYESIHNTKYWTMDEYVGLGLASHSYSHGKRYYNTSNMSEYLTNMSSGKSVRTLDEILNKDDIFEETLMLGMRLEKGVSIDVLDGILGESFVSKYKRNLAKVREYTTIYRGRLAIKPEYMNVMNTIIGDILFG